MAIADEGALGELVRKVEERLEDGEAISIETIQKVAGQRAAGPMRGGNWEIYCANG